MSAAAAKAPAVWLEKARASWSPLPDWVEALAAACDATSQAAVARRLGRSATLVSQTLSATYTGDLTGVEGLVRAALMRRTVACPVLGDISGDVCARHQAQPLRATNPIRTALHRACRTCPNSMNGGGQC